MTGRDRSFLAAAVLFGAAASGMLFASESPAVITNDSGDSTAGTIEAQSPGGESFPSKPNIVFIMFDDLGYGDLGVYGSVINRTPVIDAFASESMTFTDYYVNAPVCSATRAALLT